MPQCGTRYRLEVTTAAEPDRLRVVLALYAEDREPGPSGQPGRILARRLLQALVDGFPVLHPHATLAEALGGPFRVLRHERADGPRWEGPR